jgi:hypothetical protein
MDLTKRFEDAVAYQAVRISSLDVDRRYEIRSAEKVTTKFGPSVALEIKESPFNIVKVFLPKVTPTVSPKMIYPKLTISV